MSGPAPLRIGIVGPGRAGQARLRALQERPDLECAGIVEREPAPGSVRFDRLLADPGVDAVLVCTPNHLHAEQVGRVLDAGKHVAVEFPLAESPARARDLLALAAARGRVLHVEHIELLSPSQRWLREAAIGLGRPRAGELRFSGNAEGWIADPARAGSPALGALARLHRLVDLFGSARPRTARLTRADGMQTLEVELEFAAGGQCRLVERRALGAPRASEWAIDCEHGRLVSPPAQPASGLFAADLDVFVRRIREGAPSYVSDARVLELLECVAEIEALYSSSSDGTD